MAKHGTDFYDKSVAQDGPIVQCVDVRMYKSKAMKERMYKLNGFIYVH